MGVATSQYQFHNVPPIWPILQKGRTTIGWTWWRHRNQNSKVCPPQKIFSKLGPWSEQRPI